MTTTTMNHDAWVEAAGHLAGVAWHIQAAGLAELQERMNTARYLLEEQRSPAAAARKLVEIGEILRQDRELSVRLLHHEQARARHPKVLIRLSQLAADWSQYRHVELMPVSTVAVASWEVRSA